MDTRQENRQIIINIMGLPGSGKTTLAKKIEKELNFDRIEKDAMRIFFTENISLFSKGVEETRESKEVRGKIQFEWIVSLLTHLARVKRNIILEGGVHEATRQHAFNLVQKENPSAEIFSIWINLPEELLLERLRKRDETGEAYLPSSGFERVKNLFEEPQGKNNLLVFREEKTIEEMFKEVKEFINK